MATPYFVADSASVTILRSLASSAFGSYSLNLPEGIDLEDVHDFDAPGNELGFVAGVSSGKRVGGLARRFVRADVSVTAADSSNPDVIPESNVDQTLRDVSERVSGDFFLESDVSKAGLGPWVPFVDFQVGDMARVEIWGQVVILPVTRIEPVISDHDVVDWTVHVGGQLVSDEEARQAENQALHRAVVQDRRELAGIEAVAKSAKSTAETAQGTAETADGKAEDAQTTADSVGVVALGAVAPLSMSVPEDAAGTPYWAYDAEPSTNLPPHVEDVGEPRSYYGAASSPHMEQAFFRGTPVAPMKISFWAKRRDDTSPTVRVRLLDTDGADRISSWRRWQPTQGVWQSTAAAQVPVGAEWTLHSVVVWLSEGTTAVRLDVDLGSTYVYGLQASVFNEVQEQVDAVQSEQIASNARQIQIVSDQQRMYSHQATWQRWRLPRQTVVGGGRYNDEYIDAQIFPSGSENPSQVVVDREGTWWGQVTIIARFSSGDMDVSSTIITNSTTRATRTAQVRTGEYTSAVIYVTPWWGPQPREYLVYTVPGEQRFDTSMADFYSYTDGAGSKHYTLGVDQQGMGHLAFSHAVYADAPVQWWSVEQSAWIRAVDGWPIPSATPIRPAAGVDRMVMFTEA